MPLHKLRRAGYIQSLIVFSKTADDSAAPIGDQDVTFSSQSIGSAPTGDDRRFIVVCGWVDSGAANRSARITNLKIGGTSATEIVSEGFMTTDNTYKGNGGVWYREISSGTTTDIVATFDTNRTISNPGKLRITVFSFISPVGGLTFTGNIDVDYSSPFTQNPAYSALGGDVGLSWVSVDGAASLSGWTTEKSWEDGWDVYSKEFNTNLSGNLSLDSALEGSVSAIIVSPA